MALNRLKPVYCLLFFILFISAPAFTQNITGIWQGYFITEDKDHYKLEVQADQSKQLALTGVTYSYLTTVFYGKATMVGNYNRATKTALMQEVKTVELRMSGGSVACIMKYKLKYSRSGKEEFLEGTYTSTYEKTDLAKGIRAGGDCGGGKVYLRKVQTSDFYVEPFLRTRPPATTNRDIARTQPPEKKQETTAPVRKPPTTKPQANKETTKTTPRTDTVKKNTNTGIIVETPKKTIPELKLPSETRSRPNELLQTVNVQHEEITVRIYDNGEIDDDTVSVYWDNELVLSKKRLTASPLVMNLKVNEDHPEHVLVMVAENLGRIPPNTSLMIVNDGDKRYVVRVTSTEQKNAMIRFRYQKKN